MGTNGNHNQLSLMIVAPEGWLRDGLLSIANTNRSLRSIGVASFAEVQVGQPSLEPVDIFLVDCSAGDPDSLEGLSAICRRHSDSSTIAIVDNLSHAKAALACGAEAVLLRGYSSQEFHAAIDEAITHE